MSLIFELGAVARGSIPRTGTEFYAVIFVFLHSYGYEYMF